MRSIYDWMMRMAGDRRAPHALFWVSFAESSFFPIPPDVLLVALCLGDRTRAFRFAFWCSVASVLGGLAGYGIGAFFWDIEAVQSFFYHYVFSEKTFADVTKLYEDWNFWIVFIAAFTPIPYKVITITAGVCGIGLPMFLVASIVGRSARFYLVAWALWRFGEPASRMLDKHLGWITTALAALGIGGFVALKYLV
jgi:membrane protein YqaA with SNARE-associated domain